MRLASNKSQIVSPAPVAQPITTVPSAAVRDDSALPVPVFQPIFSAITCLSALKTRSTGRWSVPVTLKPEHVMIAVSGDPLRSNCYLFVHNGMLGFPVTRSVALPKEWRSKLRGAGT